MEAYEEIAVDPEGPVETELLPCLGYLKEMEEEEAYWRALRARAEQKGKLICDTLAELACGRVRQLRPIYGSVLYLGDDVGF